MTYKIGVIGDLHLGARGGSKYMREFMHNYILNKLEYFAGADVNQVVFVGDINNSRTNIHMMDAFFLTVTLRALVEKLGLKLIVLVGNHDSHFKEDLTINTPYTLMREYATIIDSPSTYSGGLVFIPWVCKTNEDKVNKYIKDGGTYCFGHFDLMGFQFSKGVYSKDGMDAKRLRNFDKVITGHYHVKQTGGNIHYVGSPYPITWTEVGTDKGVHILHPDTGELEFIENSVNDSLFVKVEFEKEPLFKESDLVGKIVKCVIKEKSTPMKMKKFFDSMSGIDLIRLDYIDQTETEIDTKETVNLEEDQINMNETVESYVKENELSDDLTKYALDVIKDTDTTVSI